MAKRATKPPEEKRRMPITRRWLDLPGPSEQEIAKAKETGDDVMDFTGWRVFATGSRKLGMMSETLRKLAELAELEERLESDGAPDATPADLRAIADGYLSMINFCAAHVTEWDFVDEEGEPIPYSDEAWHEIPTELVLASFRTIQSGAQTPPKGS